jgi:hypothetical protein
VQATGKRSLLTGTEMRKENGSTTGYVRLNVKRKFVPVCGLVVRISGHRTEMCCVSCEVRTEFTCYVEESRSPLWSSGQSSWLQNGNVLCFL